MLVRDVADNISQLRAFGLISFKLLTVAAQRRILTGFPLHQVVIKRYQSPWREC